MKNIKWGEPDVGDEEIASVVSSLKYGYVGANGPVVRQFEQEFARKLGARYAIAVNNGTSALLAALLAFRHRLGSIRVGVPTFSFIASANTAAEVGSAISLIDCNPKTWNIEYDLVPHDIDVLMTVDVGGLSCDYDRLKGLGVPIIADSAESAGAKYKGESIGAQANVHCFSFHRAKIITTGEGGMITTNNGELCELIRTLVNHGYDPDKKPWEYKHIMRAFNFRMTELEAAVGLVQLRKLDRYVSERRRKASIYRDIIAELAEYQEEPEDCLHPYFFFGILIEKEPGRFCEEMYKMGIEVKTWPPAHRQRPYRNVAGHFPNADRVADRIVLLPIHNGLTEKDVEYVAEMVRKLLKR